MIQITIQEKKQYFGKKFRYEYGFNDEGGVVKLRYLQVEWKELNASIWEDVLFFAPAFKNRSINKRGCLRSIDLPIDIQHVKCRKDIIIPQKIIDKVQKLTTLPVVKELCRR